MKMIIISIFRVNDNFICEFKALLEPELESGLIDLSQHPADMDNHQLCTG